MSNNNTSSGGIGFCGLLTLVFIVLKLTDNIDWSWWWVLSPLWIPIAIYALVALALFVFVKCVELTSSKEQRAAMKQVWEDHKRNEGKSKWQQRIEQMQEAQKVSNLCKELPGKRAIHSITKIAGVITCVKPDSEGNDVWVVLDNGTIGGHHHYFYIEGERGVGGELFEKYKHLHFK